MRMDRFLHEAGAPYGLRPVAGEVWLSAELLPSDAASLVNLLRESREAHRIRAMVPAYGPEELVSTGLSLVVLNRPVDWVVAQVLPNSPADRAGVLPGDRVLEVGGFATDGDNADLAVLWIQDHGINRPATWEFRRGSSLFRAELTPEPLDAFGGIRVDPRTGRPATLTLPADGDRPALTSPVTGLQVMLDTLSGRATVADLDYPSPAFAAGIQIGDQIAAIHGQTGLTEDMILRLVRPGSTDPVRVDLRRGTEALAVDLVPETYDAALSRIGRTLGPDGPAPLACLQQVR